MFLDYKNKLKLSVHIYLKFYSNDFWVFKVKITKESGIKNKITVILHNYWPIPDPEPLLMNIKIWQSMSELFIVKRFKIYYCLL